MNSINEQLRVAAESGDEAEVEALLLNPKCDPLSKDDNKDGMTAVMIAASNGHEACLQLLLPVSDPLAKDHWGGTALMHAASDGHASCVNILLPLSDISAKNNEEDTASEIASSKGHSQLAMFITAYAAARSEKTALSSSIPAVAPQKSRSLRM